MQYSPHCEIAPGIGLADVVCDLVSSGSTLFLHTIQYCGSSDNIPGSVIIVYSESHSVHCTIYSIDTPVAYLLNTLG